MEKLYRMATLAGAALFATTMLAVTPTETFRTDEALEPASRVLNLHSTPAKATKAGSDLNQDYGNYTWKDLGMAKYRENIVTSITTFVGYMWEYYEVPIQEAKEVPGLYRLVNPYGKYAPFTNYTEGDPENSNYDPNVTEYLYIHSEGRDADGNCYTVWIDQLDSQFHSTTSGYGNYHMSSYAYNYFLDLGFTKEDAMAAGRTGMFKEGAISFPQNTLIVALDGYNMQDGIPGWNVANQDGLFSVLLPEAVDYSIRVKPKSVCAKDNKVTVDFFHQPGTKVKYGLFEGRISINAVDEYALYLETNGIDLPEDSDSLEITVPEGIHTLIAITVDGKGEAQVGAVSIVYGINDDNGNWDSLGNTTWVDDFLPTFYSWKEYETLQCELQIRKDGQWLRLVNPYKNHSLFGDKNYNDHAQDHNHYLIFKVNNPKRCEIKYSSVGFGLEGCSMIVGDYVNYYRDNTPYDDDRIYEEGLFGWLSEEADGTWLRYDDTCVLARIGSDDAIWRACNDTDDKGVFGIKIPMEEVSKYFASVQDILDSEAAGEVCYFNLQGQRVENPQAGSVVIKKQGTKSTKMLVK